MKINMHILKSIKNIAITSVMDSADARCPCFCYQSKVPLGLKKLNKENE